MLVRNHLETGNLAYEKQLTSVHEKKEAFPEQKTEEPEKAAELTLSGYTKQAALENEMSAESNVFDVSKADEMIRQANRNILNQADDALKVQSGQTIATVVELLK